VWGWLLLLLRGRWAWARPSLTELALFAGSTLLLSLAVLWLVDSAGLAWFAGSAVLAFIVHLAWRQNLAEGDQE